MTDAQAIMLGMMGGFLAGLVIVLIHDWSVGRQGRRAAHIQREEDIGRVARWCQEKIDAAVRANDVRWVRRVLK